MRSSPIAASSVAPGIGPWPPPSWPVRMGCCMEVTSELPAASSPPAGDLASSTAMNGEADDATSSLGQNAPVPRPNPVSCNADHSLSRLPCNGLPSSRRSALRLLAADDGRGWSVDVPLSTFASDKFSGHRPSRPCRDAVEALGAGGRDLVRRCPGPTTRTQNVDPRAELRGR